MSTHPPLLSVFRDLGDTAISAIARVTGDKAYRATQGSCGLSLFPEARGCASPEHMAHSALWSPDLVTVKVIQQTLCFRVTLGEGSLGAAYLRDSLIHTDSPYRHCHDIQPVPG